MDRTQELISMLDKIRNLPTLPVVIQQLRTAVRDPNSDAVKVARIIEDDPAMMARILKVVNSVLYMGREPISSLQLAVSRLGLNAISNIAMSTGIFTSFPKTGQTDFNREDFWRHSISTGIAVSVLYEHCKPNLTKRYSKDILHLAGLLHDIGKIILEQFLHKEFVDAVNLAQQKGITLLQAEQEVFGSDHAQLGSWLGMKWNLGQELLQSVRWHHQPDSADIEHQELVMLCHSANYICNLEKIGNGGDVAAPAFQHAAWLRLGLTVKDITTIVDIVNEEAKKSEVLMSFVG